MDLVRIASRISTASGVNWALVRGWASGRDPSEYGWVIGDARFTGSDLQGVADEQGLLSLGIPEEFVRACTDRGYAASEFDVFLMDNQSHFQVDETPPEEDEP